MSYCPKLYKKIQCPTKWIINGKKLGWWCHWERPWPCNYRLFAQKGDFLGRMNKTLSINSIIFIYKSMKVYTRLNYKFQKFSAWLILDEVVRNLKLNFIFLFLKDFDFCLWATLVQNFSFWFFLEWMIYNA